MDLYQQPPVPPSDAPDEDDPASGNAAGRSFSEMLRGLADDPSRARIFVSDLLLLMQDRAFGALLFIFAMPNTIPTPPGTSAILGIPLVFLSAQMALGRAPWLPKLIAGRSMLRTDFAAMIGRTGPWIARAERMLKPRLSFLTSPLAERLIGCFCLILAIVLALPIPLGNMLPALGICLIAFGILEKDGLWILAGVVLGIVSLFLVAGVAYALLKSLIYLLVTVFS
jgi:hypothetical protein